MTLEEARELVQRQLPEGWVTAPYGWADLEMYQVVAGPPEWVNDGDAAWAPEDGPVFLVERDTGTIHQVSYLMVEERLMEMEQVGTGHPAD